MIGVLVDCILMFYGEDGYLHVILCALKVYIFGESYEVRATLIKYYLLINLDREFAYKVV